MIEKRPIKPATLFRILKGKKPYFILGFVFVCLSVFILFPLFTYLILHLKTPSESYDYQNIEKNGVSTTAVVKDVVVQTNTQINNKHPIIIYYQYQNNGQSYADEFETMQTDSNNQPFKAGDTVNIKVYKQQSIIEGFQPFSFPYRFLYILPFVFFLVGIPFLLFGLIPGLRNVKLYQYGVIKEATIESLKSVFPRGKNKFKPYLIVGYSFKSMLGERIYGESYSFNMTGLSVGNKVKIYVLDENENRNCLVEVGE